MESYGSYQTSRELASGRGSIVFAATKTGDASAGHFAVKVVSPIPVAADPFGEAAEAAPIPTAEDPCAAFLSSIEVQKRAAAASPYVAPILEAGRDERGTWSVTARYPRSLQTIIAGRVALNQAGVFHLLQAVVAGLLQMKRAVGRSHGRLKPDNVLIGAGATIVDAQVHLSDPAPDGLDAARGELADLRAVGLLLFQLVRRREVSDDVDDSWLILPLEATKEWTDVFGSSTPGWLAIGNALLDRNLSLDRYNLETLSRDLTALSPKPPVSRRTMVAAGAVFGLLVAGLVTYLMMARWSTVQVAIVGPGGVDGPEDARLTVDGQPVKTTPATGARRQLKLKKNQRYELAVSYNDLAPFKTNLLVAGRPGETVELPLVFGRLVVVSVTPGADFVLTNGATVIRSNTTRSYTNAFAVPGTWSLEVKREGYISSSQQAELQAGRTNIFQVQLTARDPDKVVVDFLSTPKGATVAIVDAQGNTNDTLRTGEGMYQIRPGTYRLVASYRFWDRANVQTQLFEVLPGRDTSVKFTFPSARLVLACDDPPTATVTVSNRFLARTPGTNFQVNTPANLTAWPTGTVTLRFEAPGYLGTNLTVTMLDGQTVPVTARLTPLLGFADLHADLPALIVSKETGLPVGTNLADIPRVVGLRPGTYTLVATPQGVSGIPEETREVTLGKGQTNRVDFNFAFGRVALSSVPEGAVVDDPLRKQAVPLALLSVLPLGTTILVARHPQHAFAEESETVSLVKGQTIPVKFQFKYGTVILTSMPSGAQIRANGQAIGQTPYTNLFVPYGEVKYQLTSEQRTREVSTKVSARTAYILGRNFTVPEGYTNSFGMEFEFVPQAGLFVACFELTEGIYAKVTGIEPRGTNLDLPAAEITYREAGLFRDALSQKDGAYLRANLPDGDLYDYGIPKEAEWKLYAPPTSLDEDPDAVLRATGVVAERRPVHRPRKPGTTARLFDLYGNVAEWCEGANGQPDARGGSYASLKGRAAIPVPFSAGEEEKQRLKNVGLRCVLRRK